jgi:hypothetical protein
VKPNFTLFQVVMVILVPGFVFAGAVTQEDFQVDTTEQLLNLCSASPDDPLYNHAMNFCHGYVVGAYDYYEAAHAVGKGPKMVCFPDPPPSRNEAINLFVEWVKAHPQYWLKKPVDTEFRFLTEKYPCK